MRVHRLHAAHITPFSARAQSQEKALIEQRFRNLEATSHASVTGEEAKLQLTAPFKR
jgi:hypothetical protein